MAFHELVLLDLILSVEPLVTGHNVIISSELRLEAAKENVVLLKLVLIDLALRPVLVAALGA